MNESKIYTHIHHVKPKHMGGTDDPSNLAILTVKEHAEAHWILWIKHKNPYDRLAWLGLSGRASKEYICRQAVSIATKRIMALDPERRNALAKYNKLNGTWNRGLSEIYSEDTLSKMSFYASNRTQEHLTAISKSNKNYAKNNPDKIRERADKVSAKYLTGELINPMQGKKHTTDSLSKMSEAQSNRSWNDKIAKSLKEKTGTKNSNHRYKWFTPFGSFDSCLEAAELFGCTETLIYMRCKYPDKVVKKHGNSRGKCPQNLIWNKADVGLTHKQLGWFVEDKA